MFSLRLLASDKKSSWWDSFVVAAIDMLILCILLLVYFAVRGGVPQWFIWFSEHSGQISAVLLVVAGVSTLAYFLSNENSEVSTDES